MDLFETIEEKMKSKQPLIVAVEGRCGSGKTTLAGELMKSFHAGVIHMDDFFLRPGQRTKKRLEEIGGNIDYERFLEEAAEPLRNGRTVFTYRKYDCGCGMMKEKVTVRGDSLIVVEGVYSCHPLFCDIYDLKVFLDVDEEEQKRRIAERSSAELYRRFIEEWIPKEELYFRHFGIRGKCDIVIKT